jgi:hypothetical protein
MLVCPLALPGRTNRSGDVGPAVPANHGTCAAGIERASRYHVSHPRLCRRRPGGSPRQVRKTTEEACHAIPSAGPLDDPYGELVVTGEVPESEQEGRAHRRSRRTGRFEFRTYLPGDVNADGVNAELSEGVRTSLPKAGGDHDRQARPHRYASAMTGIARPATRDSGHQTMRASSLDHASIALTRCLTGGMAASVTPIVPAQKAPFVSTRPDGSLFTRWIED